MKLSVKTILILGGIIGSVAAIFVIRRIRSFGQEPAAATPTPPSDMQGLLEATSLPTEPTTAIAAALQEAVQEMHASQEDSGVSVDLDAPVVGNLRTLIYHPADSHNLPAEDNRMYFASEEEAVAAGYHRAEKE